MSFKSLLFLLAGIFLLSNLTVAQKTEITLKDANTGEALAFANISYTLSTSKTKGLVVSNPDGKAVLDIDQKAELKISYIGYKPLMAEIRPGEQKVYGLEPISVHIDEVVVTAQYTPTSASKSVYKINVINQSQIEKKAAKDLKEVLRTELNINIQQDNVLGSSLSMQGISGENVKILIDGVPMVGRLNGNIDLSQINMNNIERIEVVEGPMSVNYGTNALAGVINLITKDKISNRFQGGINSYYETVGKYDLDANMGVSFDKYHILASGGRSFFNGFDPLSDTSRYQAWKPKEQYFADFKYQRKLNKLKLGFHSSWFDEFVLDRGKPFKDADTLEGYYYYKGKDGKYYTTRLNNSISLNGLIFRKHFLDAVASYSYYSRIKNVYYKNLYSLNEKLSTDLRDHDTSQFSSIMARATISMFQPEESKFNYQYGFDINIEQGKGEKMENGQQRMDDYAAFLSIQYAPTVKMIIQPAMRLAYNSKYNTPITPSLNFRYTLTERSSFRASYASGFRAPSLKELYLDFVDLNHDIHGNKDLDAEKSNNLSLNYSYFNSNKSSYWKFEPSFFYNRIEGMIDLVSKSLSDPVTGDTNQIYTYQNVDEFRSLGGKIQFNYGFKDILNFNMGVGETGRYNSSQSHVNTESKYYFTPEVSANLSYKIVKFNIWLNANYKYTGKLRRSYYSADNELHVYEENAFNNLDVSLSTDFWDQSLKLVAGFKNLFDVTDINTIGAQGGVHVGESSSRPVSWGRTAFISLNYNFKRK